MASEPLWLQGEGTVTSMRRAVDTSGPVNVDGIVVLVTAGRCRDADAVRALCTRRSWPVVEVATADDATWTASARRTSLVVVTGAEPAFILATVAAVRRSSSAPLAVVGDIEGPARTRALATGADVVLPPVDDPENLLAHLLALLRRSGPGDPKVRFLISGRLEVDLWSRRCQLDGEPLPLSRTEYDLLVHLMRHARKAVRLESIIHEVWRSRAYQLQTNAARIMVSRVRAKLRSHDAEGREYIKCVRGIGYEFSQPVLQAGDGAAEQTGGEPGTLTFASTLLRIAAGLRDLRYEDAAQYAVDALVHATGSDAGAVFSTRHGFIELVAERGHPEEYCQYVRSGVRARGRTEVHPDDLTQPIQISDIAGLRSKATSLQIMAAHGFHSYLYVPLITDGATQGGLRLMSRSSRPLDPVMTMFCCAVGGLLSLAVPADRSLLLTSG